MSPTPRGRLAGRVAPLLLVLAACSGAPASPSPAASRVAVPPGRVATLADGLEPLRARFDAGADRPRLLVLASPT
jgi:hypothetical protein